MGAFCFTQLLPLLCFATNRIPAHAVVAQTSALRRPTHGDLPIVRGDALGNAYRSSEFELQRQLSRIAKPVDRAEWSVSASVPNAYYDHQLNSITFPAAILQPPLFDRQANDAANFAAIGAIIGYELTHGFDDQGRKFDGDSNLHDWWTADDSKEYERRAQCFADEYSGFEATEGVKLNGTLTLGENTADNGGLRIALMALESTLSQQPSPTNSNGFTPQQEFFTSYAKSWCSNATPQYLSMMAQSNPHATAQARANGVVSNMPEFQRAFGCKKGQPWFGKTPAVFGSGQIRSMPAGLRIQVRSVAAKAEYLGRKRFKTAANASAAARITSKEV